MFRNREVTVKVNKVKDEETKTSYEPSFERKMHVTVRALESLGAKMFLGVCVYILLDTHRQTQVAKVMYHPE